MNGYRMLGRDELIAEIQAGGKKKRSRWPRRKASEVDPETKTDELKIVDDGEAGERRATTPRAMRCPAEPKPRRAGAAAAEAAAGRAGTREAGGDARDERGRPPENEETEEITGILEITRQRHGFLSVEGSDDDVYVSASQVRRCEMKEGDEVTGPVRAPRRGERHRALVRVNLVNGEPPVDAPAPKKKGGGGGGAKADRFDSLTPVPPSTPHRASRRRQRPRARRGPPGSACLRPARPRQGGAARRADDAPARPRSGPRRPSKDLELTVLLIDERPEEVPAWSEAVPSADLALAPADLSPAEQVKVARSAVERARKQASDGSDAVLLCDSLSRLCRRGQGRRRRQAPLRLGPRARRGGRRHPHRRRDDARRRRRGARGCHHDRDFADHARRHRSRPRGSRRRCLRRVPGRRRRQDPLRRRDGRPSPPALEPLRARPAGSGRVHPRAARIGELERGRPEEPGLATRACRRDEPMRARVKARSARRRARAARSRRCGCRRRRRHPARLP